MRCRNILLLFVLTFPADAGILIYRTDQGVALTDAFTVLFDGKDKILKLGSQPKLAGPINKLPSGHASEALLRDAAAGVLAEYEAVSGPEYILPGGTPKKSSENPEEIWKSATLTYRKSQSDKTQTDLDTGKFIAFLPSGAEGLASLCMDRRALALIGGKEDFMPAQIEIGSAAVKAYGKEPAMAAVEAYVRTAMRSGLEQVDRGVQATQALEQALQFAKLSEELYPALPEHRELREGLYKRKVQLTRQLSVLRALYAGDQWDAFLVAYRPFEKHQLAFPEMMKCQRDALTQSLNVHWKAGKDRLSSGEYRSAFRELQAAEYRQPSNAALEKDRAMAWSEYSRLVAEERRSKRKQLGLGQKDAINQSLHFATRYREQGKLEAALSSVAEAESIDPDDLAVVRMKAEILGARKEYGSALAMLEKYDQLAVDEERVAGSKLRNELLFEMKDNVHSLRAQAEKAWSAGRYHETRRVAAIGLRSDPRDPDLLYYAGVTGLVTRNRQEGMAALNKYMEVSNTLDGNAERRVAVLRLLSLPASSTSAEADGEKNWFSAKKVPPGALYCPLSMAFQAKVDHIDASNKLKVRYVWDGDRLKLIVPNFDKGIAVTSEKAVQFTYSDVTGQVMAVTLERDAPRELLSDPDDVLRMSNVILGNNPLVDGAALERVAGKRVTIGVTGNPYFQPFVWQDLHYFAFVYDDAGRLKSAHEVPAGPNTQGVRVVVDFEWNGPRLVSVKAYNVRGTDESGRTLVYERRQQYQENRLVAEEIHYGNKTSHIKYAWNGADLVSAKCDKDESLDDRSREVQFIGYSAKGR